MPELPEVETVRRGLVPLVTRRTIVEAGSHPSHKFRHAVDAVGATITTVRRRGKYLLFDLGDGRNLVVHLGMTGQLRLHPSGQDPDRPQDPYVRAWWALDDHQTLVFRDVRRFGRIAVVGEDLSELPTLAQLGPEPFDPTFDPDHLWVALRGSTVKVKTQLLNQRVVAGVGNIYADEALWRAGVHPGSRRVSKAAATHLHQAIVEVLDEGIAFGGTTLRDYRNVDGDEGANQHRLDCYGRAGRPCPRCAEPLRRTTVDGRGTTHCPRCQRR